MASFLFAWIGLTDIKASQGDPKAGMGPIAQAVAKREFQQIHLISDHSPSINSKYKAWLEKKTQAKIHTHFVKLSSPTHFGDIYENAVNTIEKLVKKDLENIELVFHLSPGTPAMAAVWVILSKTRFPAELIESSTQKGVQTAAVPFDISADYLPDLLKKPDRDLKELSEGKPDSAPEFNAIIHRCASMKELIAMAQKVAPRNIPVLILGESGTGKELFARAIHQASPRKGGFVPVNCGAIPKELIESELFGHEKGAFTGATSTRKGYIEESSGGTLFLDEIGDLPLNSQVKLLRVLQDQKVTRLGSTRPISVDLRILAATNKDLMDEIDKGFFREDLFHRIAVALLQIPPLRDRAGDLKLLSDFLMEEINKEAENQPGYESKKLSASARNFIDHHPWPGNIRELRNTLLRAALWSSGKTINDKDLERVLIAYPKKKNIGILDHPIGHGLKINEIVDEVVGSYLDRAMKEAGGNKSKAAKLLGLPSYQTLTNWLKKYGINS